MIEYYGENTLNNELKEKNNNIQKAIATLLAKKIGETFISPINLKLYCDICKTKIEEIFPDTPNSKMIVFIDRNNLNYFNDNKYKEGKCPGCNKSKKLFFNCSCQTQWYCSKKCQYKNFNNHFKNCQNYCLDISPLKENIFSVKAICRLENLGNTSYMNAALQCLSNCWELTDFFLNKNFKSKSKLDNPLGYKGILCKSYSNLIHHLWYGMLNVYNPATFVSIIGKINKTFIEKFEQDPQEFLNFLIDGLHEDLNLVIDKPNVQEEKIKNYKIKSKIEWLNFKKRNQSVLIELFYGQFLSKIVCPNPDCQYPIYKYEPFMSLSLPLYLKNERIKVKCFFIFYYTNIKPILIELIFKKDSTIMALRNKISKILDVHPFSFVICKLNSKGALNYYVNYKQKISILEKMNKSNNEVPFFLMQLNPEIYNESINNSYKDIKNYQRKNFETLNKNIPEKANLLKELFDKDEDEEYITNMENAPISYYQKNFSEERTNRKNDKNMSFGNIVVDNYGLNDNFILVPLYINCYNEKTFNNPEFIIFPRILLLKKDITCKEIHKLIFKVFRHVINIGFEKEGDFEQIFSYLKSDMEKDYNKNDTYEFHCKRDYLYRLRIVNINKKKININENIDERTNSQNINKIKSCLICGQVKCRNCLLPYSDRKLSYYLDQVYPKNNKRTVDGTYYFLNDNQRKMINEQNQDFQLEMTWLQKYKNNLYNLINDYEKLNFEPKEKIENKTMLLTKCFDYFMKWETLENYSFKCEVCKSDKPPSKKIQIYRCPYYLIIHLKRFSDDKNKIKMEVLFPIRGLDLNKYVKDKEDDPIDKIYDLKCIINHTGDLVYEHYHAICYNTIHNKWLLYNDDDEVIEINEKEISAKDANILFYRRRKSFENMIDFKKNENINSNNIIMNDNNNIFVINKKKKSLINDKIIKANKIFDDNGNKQNNIKNNFINCPLIGLDKIWVNDEINAILQCFCHIEKFVNFFKYNPQINLAYINNINYLCYSFKLLIENLWPDNYNPSSKNKYYSPNELNNKISKLFNDINQLK